MQWGQVIRWAAMQRIRIVFLLAMLVLSLPTLCQSSATQAPKFDHATVYVRDLEKSATFYEKVLGFEKIPEPFKDGRHVWFRIGPHDQLHVVSGATKPSENEINVHLAFRVASVPDFAARLDKAGVKYRKSIRGDGTVATPRPDGVNQIYFQDPDGYWIEVNDDRF
jgi:lactoylglutathione lyase